ncbi:MAG: hypothetical protein WCA56_12975 [Xanthobacteraceae bacterium]|jgi:hypothetical protein
MSPMVATKIIGLVSTVFVIGFLLFGLRQGLRARREEHRDKGPSGGST